MTPENKTKYKHITTVLRWMQIIAPPLFVGIVIGFMAYSTRPDLIGMIIGISIALLGLITGIVWAMRLRKRYGTIHFLSEEVATTKLVEPMKEDLPAATQDVKMKEAEKATPEKRSVFEILFEVMGWMRIVASPLIVGIVIGFIVYINSRNLAGMLAGIGIATVGLIIGMTWATRVWKKHGTIHFVSRVMATPELDNPEEKIDKPGK